MALACPEHKTGRVFMSKRYKIILLMSFFIGGLILPSPAFAGEGLSLEQLLEDALKSNPEIMAAKRASEASAARIWQAASPGDPMLEFEYNKINADRMLSGEPMKMYAISQDLPFPTKLYLRAKIAAKLARIAYEEYRAKENYIISRVKTTYAELFFIYRSIDINRENKNILDQLSQSAAARYSAGKGSQADMLKTEVELAAVDTELVMLEAKRLTLQAQLNILINKDPDSEFGIPSAGAPLSFERTLEECYSLAQKDNPELKAYRYAIERGKAAYDLSLNEFMPDVKVRFEQMVGRDRLNEKAWAGMLGVTVPLWFFSKQSFGVKEMQSELLMLKAEYAAKEKAVLYDVRDAFNRLGANKKLVELYETSFLPQAEETFNAALTGYESDKTDFLTLLDSRRMLADFKLKHYRAILDLKIALSDLERTITAPSDTAERYEVAREKK
ncbi:MAG: TolC family protein [Candidatus Omnitrophica bacterium]|nr:TolC family protein [Candidatus Omnitrophota bacterium]